MERSFLEREELSSGRASALGRDTDRVSTDGTLGSSGDSLDGLVSVTAVDGDAAPGE
jgi:hypothetical protein